MIRKATPQGRFYIRYNVPWPCIACLSLAAYRSAPLRCISDVLVHTCTVAVGDSSDSAMACWCRWIGQDGLSYDSFLIPRSDSKEPAVGVSDLCDIPTCRLLSTVSRQIILPVMKKRRWNETSNREWRGATDAPCSCCYIHVPTCTGNPSYGERHRLAAYTVHGTCDWQ